MHSFVSFNSKIVSRLTVELPAVSSAAFYGKGIFTTIAVYGGKLFLWEKHRQRLYENARKLNINISEFLEERVKASLDEIIQKNKVENGRARITFLDESSGGLWTFESNRKISLLITTADLREIPKSFQLTVSPHLINSTSPLAGIKSCNYLEKILALDHANERGFNEAVCLNEQGEIASACMANIFWLNDGKQYTPSLKTGCLPGTTREFVIENIKCAEVERGGEALLRADSIFLTSAGLGIVQVAEFEGRKLSRERHEILALLRFR